MYAKVKEIDYTLRLKCAELLSSEELYLAMKRVTNEWPYSSEHNLTNKSINRQAWLGQAACYKITGAPESVTKEAWNTLSPEVQDKANGIADKVIREYAEEKIRS
jgi:hypothetical protein